MSKPRHQLRKRARSDDAANQAMNPSERGRRIALALVLGIVSSVAVAAARGTNNGPRVVVTAFDNAYIPHRRAAFRSERSSSGWLRFSATAFVG